MDEADAGDDFMGAALQTREHPLRVGQVAWFAQDFGAQKHQRVRAQHERVGDFFGHGKRLAMSVELTNLQGRKMFVRRFHHVARHDLKVHFQEPEQFRAARRS